MSEYIIKQSKKFAKDRKLLNERRNQWVDFELRALNLIKDYIKTAKACEHYEFFYVINNNDIPNRTITNQSFIQFYAGSHPTGISIQETNRDKQSITLKGVTEHSGCLSVLQDPRGGVFFITYPSKSDVLNWEDDYIIYSHFDSPLDVEWVDIRNAIEFYIRFMRYTSIYSTPTVLEKIELWWIKLKFKSSVLNILKGTYYGIKIAASVKTGLPVGTGINL